MKLITLIALMTILSTSIMASQTTKPVEKSFVDKLFYIEPGHFKHWKAEIGTSTINEKIPTDIRHLKLQYNVYVQYNFNPNLYVRTEVSIREKEKIGTNLKAGIQSAFGMFRPYFEATLDNVSRHNLTSVEKVRCNVGVSAHLISFAAPYIELDDFLEKETLAIGLTVPVNKRFYANGEYDKNIQTKASSATIKVGYKF
jgi:hypothetical protein